MVSGHGWRGPAAKVLQGGCHCRAVRYEAAGAPFDATLCHCSICRAVSGAPMVGWFTVKLPAFRILVGSPVRYRSTAQAWRTFCGTCGTQLTFQRDGADEIDITTCSLDDPEAVPPQDQTYARSRLRWAAGIGSLPSHSTVRPMRQSGP